MVLLASDSTQIPPSTTRMLADQLATMQAEIDMLKAAMRTGSLGSSSIDDGSLTIKDGLGNVRGSVGMQPDGSFSTVATNGPPPPRPNLPDLVPFPAGIGVNWNGTFATGNRPGDFLQIEVYRGSTADFIAGPSNFIGTIPEAGGIPDTPLDSGNTYYYLFIATNTSELPDKVGTGPRTTASEPSLVAAASPSMVVAQSVLDGIISETKLAADAVTAAKIKAGAVTGVKIAENSIESPHIIAGGIQAINLAVDSVAAGKIAADAVTAREIQALAVTANEIAANAINAGHITAGAVTAAKLEADMIITKRIIAGTSTGARTQIHPTNGIEAYTGAGVRTFWLDAATGAALLIGTIRSATSGARVEINPGGNNPETMRFFQPNGTYGEIFADPAGSGAGIFMAGSGTNRGKLLAAVAEGATSWVAGNVSQSAISCIADEANIWGGDVHIEGRAQYGAGEVVIQSRNGSGTLLNSRTLYFRGAGSGEAALYSANYDTQIVWTSGGITIQSAAGITKAITASNVAPSSRKIKKGEKKIRFKNDRTAGDVLDLLEPKQWNYEDEWVVGEPPPPPKTYTVPGDIIRDGQGRIVTDAAGNPQREPDQVVTVDPGKPVGPKFGLIAEDVQEIVPEIVQNIEAAGRLGLADRDVISILWLAVRELRQQVKALTNKGKNA